MIEAPPSIVAAKSALRRAAPYKLLDVFRGLAAVWVVMRHSCSRWSGVFSAHSPLYDFSLHGQLGVCIFFVVSGYCITAAAYNGVLSGKTTVRYAYERFRRIYPPYFAGIVLSLLSLAVIRVGLATHAINEVHHLQTLPASPRYWIGNLLLCQYPLKVELLNVVYWSLCYEIFFYLIIGVFLFFARRIALTRGVEQGSMLLAGTLLGSNVLVLVWLSVFGTAIFPFDRWYLFAMGAVLFLFLEVRSAGATPSFRRLIDTGSLLSAVALIVFIFARADLIGETGGSLESSRLRSIMCLAFVLLLVLLRKHDERLSHARALRPLFWLGSFSYSLYLIHTVVIPFVEILGRKAGFDGHLYWVTFWAQVVFAIAAGRLFYLLVERHFVSNRQRARIAAENVN